MPRKLRLRLLAAAVAGAVVLGVGAAPPAAFAEETGSIAGHFSDGGTPIPFASVVVYDTTFGFVAFTSTNFVGAFQINGLAPGSYKIQFQTGGFVQWSSQKRSFDEADLVPVVGGQTTTVEEAVRPYGVVSGHVFNSDGTPAAFAEVRAMSVAAGMGGNASADSTGFYTIRYLDSGDYAISFRKDFNSPTQWANNATDFLGATPIPVVAGATTTVNQTLLPVASVIGRITDAGVGVSGVQVTFQGAGSPVSTSTNPFGFYQLSVWPGTYTVALNRGGLVQYLPAATVPEQAQEYELAAGTQVIDGQLLPTGTIEGRLTDPSGSPVPFATAIVSGTTGSLTASTGFDGRFTIHVYPGDYTVAFHTIHGTQWSHGRSSAADADPVTVVANQATVLDEQLVPYGSVTITAVDSLTGAPVLQFCSSAFGPACTTDGTLIYNEALPVHQRLVDVNPQDGVHLFGGGFVDVVSGGSTSLVVPLVPGATVTATMTDRETTAPVANACVELVEVTNPSFLGTAAFFCSDESGALELTQVRPGTYRAFVWARDGVHGHMWLNNGGGGVGQFDKARTITIAPGETVALGILLLDQAGSIAGTVTDELAGAPVTGGVVALSSFDYGIGGQDGMVPIDAQGHYTMPNLGPYQWTLYYSAPNTMDGAAEWTGDAVDRDRAAHVKVKKGEVTTYDTEVGAGTTVTGHIFAPDGTIRLDSARLEFVNARSADNMGVADFFLPNAPTYTTHVKGTQQVKISYAYSANGEFREGWVGGTGFEDATVFTIPDGGEFILDVTVG